MHSHLLNTRNIKAIYGKDNNTVTSIFRQNRQDQYVTSPMIVAHCNREHHWLVWQSCSFTARYGWDFSLAFLLTSYCYPLPLDLHVFTMMIPSIAAFRDQATVSTYEWIREKNQTIWQITDQWEWTTFRYLHHIIYLGFYEFDWIDE